MPLDGAAAEAAPHANVSAKHTKPIVRLNQVNITILLVAPMGPTTGVLLLML
jgi:hypothetical protein